MRTRSRSRSHARLGVERFCLGVPESPARRAQQLVFMGSAAADAMSSPPRAPPVDDRPCCAAAAFNSHF